MGKFIETEDRIEVIKSWSVGRRGSHCLRGREFLLGMTKRFWV